MIARLSGRLLVKEPGRLVVDVGGVGYEIHVPLSTFYALPDPGEAVALEVHTHVREDAITLFGFASAGERVLFERLIGVSGVGPKLACTLLSGLPPGEVVDAVRSEEPGRLRVVPGIGRKTAERIVLEMRDRLDGLAAVAGEATGSGGASRVPDEAVSALVNLGYKEVLARKAVSRASGRIGQTPALEFLLREALRLLAGENLG